MGVLDTGQSHEGYLRPRRSARYRSELQLTTSPSEAEGAEVSSRQKFRCSGTCDMRESTQGDFRKHQFRASKVYETGLIRRSIKKVQDFQIDNFGFFDWHRMRSAGNDRFVTAWNGFGELIRVLALN
jgi:hypothetical protein